MNVSREAAYRTYQRVLRDVLEIRASTVSPLPETAQPGPHWQEALERFDYMLEATPTLVGKLRHHCFHVTPTRPDDYPLYQIDRRQALQARLRALTSLGTSDLLVPESRELGGFGYDIGGDLYNVDTLKFFEVNIGLQRMGVFDRLRQSSDRRIVWEVGGGWGGFARQFKLLVPNLTWVITDFPELFLFSATYLGSLFPEASVLIYRGPQDEEALTRWQQYDFIFLPTTLPALRPPARPALTISLASWQDMSQAQVEFYGATAAELGTEAVYSLNRDRSPDNTALRSTRDVLTKYFELADVPLLETDHTTALDVLEPLPAVGAARREGRHDWSYHHAFGVCRSAAAQGERQAGTPIEGDAVRVVIGMTLYNNCQHLPEAVFSVLDQTYANIRLIMYDDCSTDKTEILARRYERRDPRVIYIRGKTRLGMIGAWRRVFELGLKRCPNAEFFAWASDHDYWTPDWLQTLLDRLASDPSLVLAYCYTTKMSPKGVPESSVEPAFFETSAIHDLETRWSLVCRSLVGAGNMVYGLMRADALRRAGVFRRVLLPDRLLMAELSIHGRVAQVPRAMWFRRRGQPSTPTRQRRTLFGEVRMPVYAYLPWWLVHAAVIFWVHGLGRSGGRRLGLLRALRMAGRYVEGQLVLRVRKLRVRYLRLKAEFAKDVT